MKALLAAVVFVLVVFAPLRAPLYAASLAGIELPETRTVDGTALRLNGIGLRTYSLLRIKIYVAGLYLEQPSSDADAILRSPEMKLLDIHFIREVDADHARDAWREGFEKNCRPPCKLDREMVGRFLAKVGPIPQGAHSTLTFAHGGVSIQMDGHDMGTVNDPGFATVILATFIGREPPTEALKQELLGAQP